MNKHELARIFNEIGLLLELKGDNPFKVRAYYNAVRILENLTEDLEILINQDRLREIPGFGEAIVKKIKEWTETGTIGYYEKLKTEIPAGLYYFLKIPGLGPKKINQIYHSLGITGLEELEQACHNNKLSVLPGFGVKTQEKICAGIQFIKEHKGQYLLANALNDALTIKNELAKNSEVDKVEIAGSLRRFKEVVHDLDLVASTENSEKVAEYFSRLPIIAEVIAKGNTKISVVLKSGINTDLRIVKPIEFPHALQHFSGSKEHNTALRHLAKEQGYKVNEYGIFRDEEETPIYCRDEVEIYQKLGLSFIPPELREDLGEIKAAATQKMPNLAEPRDIKGIFHVHTTYSDGTNALKEMVEATIEQGYSYLGIADHSQSAAYAGGLSNERVLKQLAEIDALSKEYPGFKIFKGIEADILPNGELDYSADILKLFDYVIGSVHSQFRMSEEAMTARILKAMENPFFTILGHPTGRILLERAAYEVDLEKVINKAAEKGIILEFNANPYRYDLDWRWCRKAKAAGVLIAINPDAHSIKEIDLVKGGLLVARKGWLEKKDVFNTRELNEIEQYFSSKRNKANSYFFQKN